MHSQKHLSSFEKIMGCSWAPGLIYMPKQLKSELVLVFLYKYPGKQPSLEFCIKNLRRIFILTQKPT